MDCTDVEALAAFKHGIRDEWLAQHLGQEKPKIMAALTALMTRFCAGEDSWLARRSNSTSDPGISEARDENGRPRRTKNKHLTWSTPDSVVPNPVNGKSHSRQIETDHRILTRYWIGPARFMAPPLNQSITPTGAAGFLNKSASLMPNTR